MKRTYSLLGSRSIHWPQQASVPPHRPELAELPYEWPVAKLDKKVRGIKQERPSCLEVRFFYLYYTPFIIKYLLSLTLISTLIICLIIKIKIIKKIKYKTKDQS
jgi:hypothetical protein